MLLERFVNPREKRNTQPSRNICWIAGHAFSEASSMRRAKATLDCLASLIFRALRLLNI